MVRAWFAEGVMKAWLGWFVGAAALALAGAAAAQAAPAVDPAIEARVEAIYPKVVAWRRDIHEHPELGNREVRTSKLVADHLKALGLEVRTGVAKTGVIGILRGGRPGPVVALRADMDALPVAEQTGLPFASKATAEYNGKTVPVMHACGHDSHTAMLMGTAEVLAGMKDQIPGTVVFVFQPAEEGVPVGEEGGAELMVKQGAFDDIKPAAFFGVHVVPGRPGKIDFRPGPAMAGSTKIILSLKGRQTHGAQPWNGVDVVNLSASIVTSLNEIAARQLDVTDSPTVITIGSLQAGNRDNIIPEKAEMLGTLRTYTPERRKDVMERMSKTVNALAQSYGATAELRWGHSNPALINNPELAREMAPVLQAAAGAAGVDPQTKLQTASEDFSFYDQVAPILYWWIEATPDFKDFASAPTNHSPFFTIDESVMKTGVRSEVMVALAYLNGHAGN
jgi:amidohydrolase